MSCYYICGKKRPFTTLACLYEFTIYEILISLANISMCVLAFADAYSFDVSEHSNTLSEIIIACPTAFSICAIFFLSIRFIIKVAQAIKASRQYRGRGYLAWFQVLTLPFTYGGMDFGELGIDCLDHLGKS